MCPPRALATKTILFTLTCACCQRRHQVPLLEKACSKLIGGYGNMMQPGRLHPSLQMLTGGSTERIDFNHGNADSNADDVWSRLTSAFREPRVVIVAGTIGNPQVIATLILLARSFACLELQISKCTSCLNACARTHIRVYVRRMYVDKRQQCFFC